MKRRLYGKVINFTATQTNTRRNLAANWLAGISHLCRTGGSGGKEQIFEIGDTVKYKCRFLI